MNIEERIENKLKHSLTISRIPKKVKEGFMKLAEEEFCNDYGMTLKWLWDTVITRANIDDRFVAIEERVGVAENILFSMKQEAEKDEKVKRNDGRQMDKT